MTNHAAVLATFEDVKRIKTRKAWQLIFEVPEENYDAAVFALGGSPQSGEDRWVGIARVDEKLAIVSAEPTGEVPEGTPTPQEPGTLPLKERRPWGELSATTQAVLACKRDDFQRWICLKNGNTPPCEDNAAWHVKQFCGVTSRSHLTTTGNAERLWCGLWDDFKAYSEGRTDDALETQRDGGPG